MKETSSDSSYIDRIRSWARSKAHGDPDSVLPVSERPAPNSRSHSNASAKPQNGGSSKPSDKAGLRDGAAGPSASSPTSPPNTNARSSSAAANAQAPGSGPVIEPGPGPDAAATGPSEEKQSGDDGETAEKPGFFKMVVHAWKLALFYSWFNVLLVFVPVGIITHFVHAPAEVVFAMNAVAIVPLAGLLSFATESVAHKMGDAIGALLNVTFGNAVELIIFIIALVKNEIRIVQSSLLGSILANLLLILGMSFFLGGLRFQEQIYNATVTQMSACLLSLSVMSLVLPTAFHASFENVEDADRQSLKISRGTSVILLLVYVLYLMFQLKSHAYLYESTPQHIVQNEYANPGPGHRLWDSSSSSDTSSSSSSSDSSDSDHSRNTVSKRVRRVIRAGRRRKSSTASVESHLEQGRTTRASSFGTTTIPTPKEDHGSEEAPRVHPFPRVNSIEGSEEAVEEEDRRRRHGKRKHHKKRRKSHRKNRDTDQEPASGYNADLIELTEDPTSNTSAQEGQTVRLDFAVSPSTAEEGLGGAIGNAGAAPARRSLAGLRTISLKPGAERLVPTVFKAPGPNAGAAQQTSSRPVPRVRYGIRRTNSLPDRLNRQPQANQHHHHMHRAPGGMPFVQVPITALSVETEKENIGKDEENHMGRGAAVILLLLTTALVAVCAEFLVDSIEDVVASSSVGEIFIGLIILPVVGNAAEHVTAVAVAMKNKMDLSIGVAIGSSIQIALFITPLVVILGWILDRDMTLYFSLFETVCLFVSAFIVNFLVLDGRSNYLEGALLCSTYVIIAVVAFFYPAEDQRSDAESVQENGIAHTVANAAGHVVRSLFRV